MNKNVPFVEGYFMSKYIGQEVEMIYIDSNNKISQRKVKVLSVNQDYIKAFCYLSYAPRTFKRENILSIGQLKEVWSA